MQEPMKLDCVVHSQDVFGLAAHEHSPLVDRSAAAHAVEFRDVEVRYSEFVVALKRITFTIKPGEFVFLVGSTGSGKSTILKLLDREVRPTGGTVLLNGLDVGEMPERDIPRLRRQLGIIPQDFALLPGKRVWENVGYAMRAVGHSRREVRRSIPGILEQVNIGHRADAFPNELSGGEQQRVAIARALVNNPLMILADEPTGNLDPQHSLGIMETLLQLNQKGATVIVATHDLVVVEKLHRRVITLAQGAIVSDQEPA